MNDPKDVELALSELAWASSNYLEYRANPHEFTGEPRYLLLRATFRAFELLKESERHWTQKNAEAQESSLKKSYEDINVFKMMDEEPISSSPVQDS